MASKFNSPLQTRFNQRNGSIFPALLIGLVVVTCSIALVFDRLWLETVRCELIRSAESAVLAAMSELITDDRLRQSQPNLIPQARLAAAHLTFYNQVQGKPVELRLDQQQDIRFGRFLKTKQNTQKRFIETETDPQIVLLTARRDHSRGNPVPLFFGGLTQHFFADVSVQVAASFENRVVGIKPLPLAPVPALPLAILKQDAQQRRVDTWKFQIENRQGTDRFSYDRKTNQVLSIPDGIPEITLHVKENSRFAEIQPNVSLVDLGTDFKLNAILKQISKGLTTTDLKDFQGELLLNQPSTSLRGLNLIEGEVLDQLQQTIGECRICFLYEEYPERNQSRRFIQQIKCVGFVAGRIMDIRYTQRQGSQIIFQPGVIKTRTAVVVDERTALRDSRKIIANPYIYKVRLTHLNPREHHDF